tara:strand:- start:2192 stop:2647 length:456 start_codon:yes stop_codon:yes gene_type:complete
MKKDYLIKKLLPAIADSLDCESCNVDDFIFNGDHTEDKEPDKCICGVNILDKFSIRHINTNEVIYPIGSECIKHFKNMEDFKKIERFKHLTNLHVRGGKYKGLLISDLYPSILNRFYTMNNYNNKVYIKEIKEYYKLKNIDKIEKYFKKLP